LGRALDRLDATDPARADLALDWCEALLAAGDVGPAKGAIDELGRFIGDSQRLRAWHTCFTGQLAALTDPQALRTTGDAVAAAAEALASLGDAAGEAKAHFVHAVALARLGKVGACEAALDRALAAARRGDDGLRQHGLGIDAAQAAALLGRALLAQGRAAEAEALSHESEALAGDDLQAAIAWRGVRAEALARRGEHASAVEFARAAVDIAA